MRIEALNITAFRPDHHDAGQAIRVSITAATGKLRPLRRDYCRMRSMIRIIIATTQTATANMRKCALSIVCLPCWRRRYALHCG